MSALTLTLRTPTGVLVDRPVDAVVAEDASGWFGVLPGRADVVAVLPPGLLVYRHADGEGFVALSGGLLDLKGGTCRVMARQAVAADRLEDLSEALKAQLERRRKHSETHRGVLDRLAKEALRRLAAGGAR